jgi:hypothetical protein
MMILPHPEKATKRTQKIAIPCSAGCEYHEEKDSLKNAIMDRGSAEDDVAIGCPQFGAVFFRRGSPPKCSFDKTR